MYFRISQFSFHIKNIRAKNAVITGKIAETEILVLQVTKLAAGSRECFGEILRKLLLADKINMIGFVNRGGILQMLADKDNLRFWTDQIDLFGKRDSGKRFRTEINVHEDDVKMGFFFRNMIQEIRSRSKSSNFRRKLQIRLCHITDLRALNRIIITDCDF